MDEIKLEVGEMLDSMEEACIKDEEAYDKG